MLDSGLKKLTQKIICILSAAVITSAATAGDSFSPQTYTELIKTEPYKSKGLTPVELKMVEGLAPQIIAQNGAAKMKIVIPPNSAYYKEVAALLKEYLDQATGASFQIVTSVPAENAIFVGPVDLPELKPISARTEKLPAENFIVESFAKGIALIGNDRDRAFNIKKPLSVGNLNYIDGMQYCSRGTLFAAMDFLERFAGVRWYFWGPLYTCVPDLKTSTLQMPAVAYQDGPVFPVRHGGYTYSEDPLNYKYLPGKYKINVYKREFWEMCMMKKGDCVGSVPNHTDCNWDEFYKDRPELFALRADGTRMNGGKGAYSSQRCYGNPEGLKEHLKVIEEYLQSGKDPGKFTRRLESLPNDKYIYWVPNDGFIGCQCPYCLKLTDSDATPDSTGSRLIWDYTVRLSDAIKARWPDKKLCVLAYGNSTAVPPNMKLPDNVLVTTCIEADIPACFMKEPAYRKINQERLDALCGKTANKPTLWLYYPHLPYQINKIPIPYFAPHVQVEFLKTNRDKVQGAFLNMGLLADELNGQSVYVYWKALWNPDFNVDEYLAEYAALMYGPAAVEMKKYMDLVISRWEKTRWSQLPAVTYNLPQTILAKLYWDETYPRDIRDQLQKMLQEALAKTTPDSIYYDRVKIMIDSAASFFAEGKIADETIKPVADCTVFANPPVIDGELTEWGAVKPLELKTWMGKTAAEKTEIFTAFDKENFYIAGKVTEPDKMMLPDGKSNKDNIFSNDAVEIFLCSEQPGMAESLASVTEQFYQIVINAKGGVVVYCKDRAKLHQELWTKDFPLKYAVKPFGSGFKFELAIPYKTLNAVIPVSGRTQWFANFYRDRPRGEDKGYQAWSPTMGKSFFDTSTFGIIRFIDQPLFAVDFSTSKPAIARNDAEGDKLMTRMEIKDGRIIFTAKAAPELKKDANPYVYLNVPPFQLTQPVAVEWAFRYKGKGIKSIGLCLKSSKDPATGKRYIAGDNYYVPADLKENSESGWIKAKLQVSKAKDHMENITFWDFGVIAAPGADFTLEVDYIKIFPQK
ncbi:MAG: DUF4838 domain-containing protein [Victivallaceae bacterium]|jgi:hypothetical protein